MGKFDSMEHTLLSRESDSHESLDYSPTAENPDYELTPEGRNYAQDTDNWPSDKF